MNNAKATNEEVIAAYSQTRSVWGAAKRLGMCGQSVWERLKRLGFQFRDLRWTDEEIAELTALVESGAPIRKIANQLGRTYGAIATQVSSRGLAVRRRNGQWKWKVPRGAGFDKATVKKRLAELAKFDGTVYRFCRTNTIHLDPFVKAIQKHFPDWWQAYVKDHGTLPALLCPGCDQNFSPLTKKQRCCSRKCQEHYRADRQYFGGKRKNTIGLADGVCQLCLQKKDRGLSSHHLLGKENDPENQLLIALCLGCHQLVGMLAGRKFVNDPSGWENLINLVMIRKHPHGHGIHSWVDIDFLTAEDVDADALEWLKAEMPAAKLRGDSDPKAVGEKPSCGNSLR